MQINVRCAQVPRGSRRRVRDVLRVRRGRTHGRRVVFAPGSWQELHRSDCSIERLVGIQHAVVRVLDYREPILPVEHRAEDRRTRNARPARIAGTATAPVIRFHQPDAGENFPTKAAARSVMGLHGRSALIGDAGEPWNRRHPESCRFRESPADVRSSSTNPGDRRVAHRCWPANCSLRKPWHDRHGSARRCRDRRARRRLGKVP
jgi:hypothetical protein